MIRLIISSILILATFIFNIYLLVGVEIPMLLGNHPKSIFIPILIGQLSMLLIGLIVGALASPTKVEKSDEDFPL